MVRETHCGGSGGGGGHERERWAVIYPLGRGERKKGRVREVVIEGRSGK